MFSADEQSLLDNIPERSLRLCLDYLRQAVEELWAPGTPRVIRDFTDHGIEHYRRIAKYLTELLKANQREPLSPIETFLLTAGIYLHDVGMQCDVTTSDGCKIRRKAEELFSARLPQLFSASSASSYSLEEQKAIRRNHHLLSAAWIDHAKFTLATALGPAVGLIPDDLVQDLTDVCRFHTTLPINECPRTLAGGRVGRKQLVAALLRFADELDIDSSRVNLAAVTNFSVDSSNSVFWWLHHLTTVAQPAPNIVNLTVRLNPTDYEEFAPLVKEQFIDRFLAKNEGVMEVLHDHGLPVHVFGRVASLRQTATLPSQIKDKLCELAGVPSLDLPIAASAEKLETCHPQKDKGVRGPLQKCKFHIMSPRYQYKGRWRSLADVMVEVIGGLPGGESSREAYLIPSGLVLPKLRDADHLRGDPELLERKREATRKFLKEWEDRELEGVWFTMPTQRGQSVGVYCLAYDLYLNASVTSGQVGGR